MRKNEGKLIGILVTVIIHLIAGIIFMLLQITALKRDYSDKFEIEIAPVEETYVREKLIELPATTVERIFKGDDEMLNIASVNNYIDEQKRISEINETESIDTRNDTVRKNVSERPEKSQEIAANFKGPTRIYYNMTGRNHLYLPIPIYKCQGSGKVVLYIDVNQKGFVERALVIEEESSTSDPCLIETAVNTALVSRFNADINSPKIQRGTLSYQFVAQ
jgi:hypothetical protein